MSSPAFHVLCGYADSTASDRSSNQSLMSNLQWSETGSATGVSSNAAPSKSNSRPVFMVNAAVDSYISISGAPNASASPRMLIKAGIDYYIYGNPSDKIAWANA